MGDEADADWQAGLVEWGRRDTIDRCMHGHVLNSKTVYVDPRGYEHCRICRSVQGRLKYQKARDERGPNPFGVKRQKNK
jgi:hypothetical protein